MKKIYFIKFDVTDYIRPVWPKNKSISLLRFEKNLILKIFWT